MKKETVKITINLSVDLMKKIEEYADSFNINRTSAMCVLMSQALEQRAELEQKQAILQAKK